MKKTYDFKKLQNILKTLVNEYGLHDEEIDITCSVLTPKQAIGDPGREDFPIQKGKEKLMQACIETSYGQAFTDMPNGYKGKIKDLTEMKLETNYDRAVFISCLNAVLCKLEKTNHTIHCKDDGPKKCSIKLIEKIQKEYGKPKIALFGYQPAMAEALHDKFPLRIFDLDVANIGKEKQGVLIEEGMCEMQAIDEWADLFLVTGSTICNGSIIQFLTLNKPVIYFGTTIAGAAALLGLNRFCPESS